MPNLLEQHFDTADVSPEELESFGRSIMFHQRNVNWWIGDLAIRSTADNGHDNRSQYFPVDGSPDHIDRCLGVAKAFPPEHRNPLATWAIHKQHAGTKPLEARKAAVQAAVDAGRTSDQEREHATKARQEPAQKPERWLLAVDVNLWLCKYWFGGAGQESAMEVNQFVGRTIERMRRMGVTDVACCFDSPKNHRKELTADSEHKYKDRKKKEPELAEQIKTVYKLLKGSGFACICVEGMEADDCMASLAHQFDPGRVTLLTEDKDMRQCLTRPDVNMLLGVDWDMEAQPPKPTYKFLDSGVDRKPKYAESVWELTGGTYDEDGTPTGEGIRPDQYIDYQTLMGDTADNIKGAKDIGEGTAAKLIKAFGTLEASIEAGKRDDDLILSWRNGKKTVASLKAFEGEAAELNRKLVTMRTDLEIPTNTRI